MAKKDGGSAFAASGGMSLRDYFAAQALQSLISSWPAQSQHEPPNWSDADMQTMTSQAYAFADSMLAARRNSYEQPEDIAADAPIKFSAKLEAMEQDAGWKQAAAKPE